MVLSEFTTYYINLIKTTNNDAKIVNILLVTTKYLIFLQYINMEHKKTSQF